MLKSSVIEALTWARDAWLSASDSQKKDMLLEDFDEPFTSEEQV